MKKRILFPLGCRSDKALSEPILKELEKEDVEVIRVQLIPFDYVESFQIADLHVRLLKPDLMVCVGDRVEMEAAAKAAFLKNVNIVHVYAGVLNPDFETFDAILRHNITLMSDIALVESVEAFKVVKALCEVIKKKDIEIRVIGTSHLDNFKVDESVIPEKPYDLLLLNKSTRVADFKKPKIKIVSNRLIILGCNSDGKIDFDDVLNLKGVKEINYFGTLPHNDFLNLVKNCRFFYTNSSSAFYEAPLFLKPDQIKLLGKRNENRSTDWKIIKPGASKKIVEVLKNEGYC